VCIDSAYDLMLSDKSCFGDAVAKTEGEPLGLNVFERTVLTQADIRAAEALVTWKV
jgi:hypothetical protein